MCVSQEENFKPKYFNCDWQQEQQPRRFDGEASLVLENIYKTPVRDSHNNHINNTDYLKTISQP